MKVPREIILKETESWPTVDKVDIEKRLGKKTEIDISEIHKLFEPSHLLKIVTKVTQSQQFELAVWERFNEIYREPDKLEDLIPGYFMVFNKCFNQTLREFNGKK